MCHMTVCVCVYTCMHVCVCVCVCVSGYTAYNTVLILCILLCTGNHCLAIFKEPESYASMQACLSDIKQEMESLTSVTINDITFDIEYYLGGDWKFLAMATGIDSAN